MNSLIIVYENVTKNFAESSRSYPESNSQILREVFFPDYICFTTTTF